MDLDLHQIAQVLVGQPCWSVVAGPPTGSMINFQIGPKIKRSKPLSNPKLTEDERQFDGTYGIFVAMAAWRLDDYQRILTAWTAPNDSGGEMVRNLNLLTGTVVTQIEIDSFSRDLMASFSDKYRLRVFCDQVTENGDSYFISIDSRIFSVGGWSEIRIESRGQDSERVSS